MKTTTENNYALLSKESYTPELKNKPIIIKNPTEETISELERVFKKDHTVAVDFETNGTDAWNVESYVVGLGISGSSSNVFIYFGLGVDRRTYMAILGWLASNKRLTAFNVLFDGAWFYREGLEPTWAMCSYGLFRYLATEGWTGQRWNLETAQRDLLGWPESGKNEMMAWLDENKLTKADMWKAPVDLMARYCILDTLAAWQLYKYFGQTIQQYETGERIKSFHQREFITSIQLLWEQNFRGMRIESNKLSQYQQHLIKQTKEYKGKILADAKVKPWVEGRMLEAYKKIAGKEPNKTTKAGAVSKTWLKWEAKKHTKLNVLDIINFNSRQQLRDLFFVHLKQKATQFTEKTGEPKIDKEVLGGMGKLGALFVSYNAVVKELGYVNALLNLTNNDTFHANYKSVGTLTGRLAGGKDDG